jgi:predicted phosphodiesterase
MRKLLIPFFLSLPLLAQSLQLPMKPKSVRFAVIGDSGTGQKEQFELAAQMVKYRQQFLFDFVLMLGDNIYGGKGASSFRQKFEQPYKTLLDAGVKFYATLGNHDDPEEAFYKPFNMGGKRYYSWHNGNAQFLSLDSTYMVPEQLDWLQQQLVGNESDWKICFFHHPFYDHARFHGPDNDLKSQLEPIFVKNGVDVVMSGHEHVYERLKPQKGIQYFILGNSGQLRNHDLQPSSETAKGFDTDQTFMLMEIAGEELYFQTIARSGATVDSGMITKQVKAKAASASADGAAKN